MLGVKRTCLYLTDGAECVWCDLRKLTGSCASAGLMLNEV